jgi:hypothetical protein
MQRAIRAFLALCLAAFPASEAAAGYGTSTTALPGPFQGLGILGWPVPESVLSLRGYALADALDEIGRSQATIDFVMRFAEVLGDGSLVELVELVKAVSEPDLRVSVDASLSGKVDRLAELFAVAIDIFLADASASSNMEATLAESSLAFAATVARLDDRTRPVAERRLLRHALRGMSAMFCIAGRPTSIGLQAELLDHAIVGYESVLRLAAGSVDETQRARVVALGLEPVDREGFDRRAEEIAVGRAALDEARSIDPTFKLPPDPAYEKPRD